MAVAEPKVLWTPSASRIERATLTRYMRWLGETRGLEFDGYHDLWRWSVFDLFHPKVVAKGAITGVKEKTIQTRTIGDAAQLGGALVIAPEGRVIWSHMSKDASDNASPEEILAAVRQTVA